MAQKDIEGKDASSAVVTSEKRITLTYQTTHLTARMSDEARDKMAILVGDELKKAVQAKVKVKKLKKGESPMKDGEWDIEAQEILKLIKTG